MFHERGVKRGVRFGIVAGVSTGAFQAWGVAQDDAPALLDAWLGIRGNSSIYKTRPLGVVGGLLGEDALYDTGPLKRLLKRFANETKLRASGRKLLLGVVNLGTGTYRSIDESVDRKSTRLNSSH